MSIRVNNYVPTTVQYVNTVEEVQLVDYVKGYDVRLPRTIQMHKFRLGIKNDVGVLLLNEVLLNKNSKYVFKGEDGNVIILPFGKDGKIPVVEIEQTTFSLNEDEDYDEDEDEDEEINEERSTCTVNEDVDEEPITWGEILEKLNQIPKELWPYTPVFGYWPDNDGAHYVIDSNFTLDGGTEV